MRNRSFFTLLNVFDLVGELHHKAPHFLAVLKEADGNLMATYHQATHGCGA